MESIIIPPENLNAISSPSIDTDSLAQALEDIASVQCTDGFIPTISISRVENEDGTVSFSVSSDQIPVAQNLTQKIYYTVKRFFNLIPKQDIDDLKDLPSFYEEVLKLPSDERYQDVVKNSFTSLKNVYEVYRKRDNTPAMAYKSDILEAIAVAIRPGGLNDTLFIDISRMDADPLEPYDISIKDFHIPIFKMEHLDEIIPILEQKGFQTPPTLKEIQQDPDLQKYLIIEKVAMGRIVNWMYKHRFLGKVLNNTFFSWAVTKWMEKTMRKEMEPGKERTERILRFFKRMKITPYEAIDGKLYSYTEMFKKKLRDEISCDAAFQRALNDTSRNMLLQKVTELPQGNTFPVISNSHCRLRVLDIPKNGTEHKFSIEGKCLNETNPHTFSIKNMFGNEDNVPISILRDFELNDLKEHAEYLYRCCLTNAVHRQSATMVVQRLAPEDIHHYCEPVGGKVLSLSKACDKLLSLMNTTDETQEKERYLLEGLIYQFNQNDPNDENSVVMIKGARTSVSTLGTKHASPLSQNDRKIMMVEHEDGSFAIHTFIGAISVNNVQVDIPTGEAELGAEVGAMGIGDHERKNSPQMATRKNSILIKQSPGSVERGGQVGVFDRSGSTVVSLYFDFSPTDKLQKASKLLKYTDVKNEVRNIEIQMKMGDVIGSLKNKNL